MSDKELKRKIESLGVITEDKMFIKYSNDGILDLIELIQEERKDAIEGFSRWQCADDDNSDEYYDLYGKQDVEEYLESEGIEREKK